MIKLPKSRKIKPAVPLPAPKKPKLKPAITDTQPQTILSRGKL